MLTVGIIGSGGISRAHLAGYLEFPEQCEVVALCDITLAIAAERRDEFGLADARVYDDPAGLYFRTDRAIAKHHGAPESISVD